METTYEYVTRCGDGLSTTSERIDDTGCESDDGTIPVILPTLSLEEKIDDTQLKPCLKNVLSDIKQLTKGMSWTVQKFSGSTPGWNWELIDTSLPPGQNGGTSQLYNRSTGTVTTRFDSNKFQNATDLSIARTILHESVHAYLITHFRVDPTTAVKAYPDLMKDMATGKYPNDANGLQHAEFVKNFIGDIAQSLKEFGDKRGYNVPLQYYSDLAWGGLTEWAKRDSQGNLVRDGAGNVIFEETPWFKNRFTNTADKQRVKTVILNELGSNGSTNQKGQNGGC